MLSGPVVDCVDEAETCPQPASKDSSSSSSTATSPPPGNYCDDLDDSWLAQSSFGGGSGKMLSSSMVEGDDAQSGCLPQQFENLNRTKRAANLHGSRRDDFDDSFGGLTSFGSRRNWPSGPGSGFADSSSEHLQTAHTGGSNSSSMTTLPPPGRCCDDLGESWLAKSSFGLGSGKTSEAREGDGDASSSSIGKFGRHSGSRSLLPSIVDDHCDSLSAFMQPAGHIQSSGSQAHPGEGGSVVLDKEGDCDLLSALGPYAHLVPWSRIRGDAAASSGDHDVLGTRAGQTVVASIAARPCTQGTSNGRGASRSKQAISKEPHWDDSESTLQKDADDELSALGAFAQLLPWDRAQGSRSKPSPRRKDGFLISLFDDTSRPRDCGSSSSISAAPLRDSGILGRSSFGAAAHSACCDASDIGLAAGLATSPHFLEREEDDEGELWL